MAKHVAVITMTSEDGVEGVDIKCTFGTDEDPQAGSNNDAAAHLMAACVVANLIETHEHDDIEATTRTLQ